MGSARFDRDRIRALLESAGNKLTGEWLLIGGAAAAAWFSPARTTEDIDLVGLGGTQDERFALMQLAAEAAQDRAGAETEALTEPADAPVVAVDARTDEISVTLAPSEGAEVKLTMQEGARTRYEWSVAGGVVNYDLHGDGRGNSTSYQQGRGVPRHSGELEAAFDGNHGWFWRNRGTSEVIVTLRVVGAHTDIRRAD